MNTIPAAAPQGASRLSRQRPRRRRTWVVRLGTAAVVLLIAAELACRYALGLGDPPLSVAHPTIEYLFKPSTTYRRFGNTVSYNAYSMRSPQFPVKKTDGRELRVMVLGDSVINGGAVTDQQDTVTSVLQRKLEEELARPVIVGNVSAGSWGPANLLAYVESYGWFDADVVVMVLSSHDYADTPTFLPIVGVDPHFPVDAPHLALQEAVLRYLPRLFQRGSQEGVPAPDDPARVEASRSALHRLLRTARHSARVVFLAQYPERRELQGAYAVGHGVIAEVASAEGVATIDLRAPLSAAGSESDLYLDEVHPTVLGHATVATALARNIRGVVAAGRDVATTRIVPSADPHDTH